MTGVPRTTCRLAVLVSVLAALILECHTLQTPGMSSVPLDWQPMQRLIEEFVADRSSCSSGQHTCRRSNGTWRADDDGGADQLCRLCHCDARCIQHGDCCLDYAAAAAGAERVKGGRYSCVSLDIGHRTGVLMVAGCPLDYRNTMVEQLCLQQVPSSAYSYILDLSVTSSATNTTYVNYYCARCNGDAGALHAWRVSLNCTHREEVAHLSLQQFTKLAHYKPGMRQWKMPVNGSKVNVVTCVLQVPEFRSSAQFAARYGSRQCVYGRGVCAEAARGTAKCIEQVRHCPLSWVDQQDVIECERYSLLLMHNNTVYRNPHCALCNGVNLTAAQATCLPSHGCVRRYRTFKLPQAFSTLMDFSDEKCDNGDLYDPVNGKCHEVHCGKLYAKFQGQCIRNYEYESKSNASFLDDECPKATIGKESFYFVEDGSVFINSTNKIYKRGEYEMNENNSGLLVCNEKLAYLSTVTEGQKLVTLAVLLLSLVCLFAHISIFILLPKARNLPGKNLFSLSCSLFVAHFLFLTGTQATASHGLCMFLGLSLHYVWLASFCWMNVMSLDVYITFRGHIHRGAELGGKTYLKYSIYAWGVPFVVIMLALLVQYTDALPDYKPQYEGRMCWINNRDALIIFFLFPIGVIVLENVSLFIVTAYGLYKQNKLTEFAMKRSQSVIPKPDKSQSGHKMEKATPNYPQQRKTERNERVRLLLYFKLGVIQGLTWTTGFLAAFTGLPACWYLFTVLNGLQGFFIFLSFDLKRKVYESLRDKLIGRTPMMRFSKGTRTTTTTTITSSSHKQSSKSQSCLSETRNPSCTDSSMVSFNSVGPCQERITSPNVVQSLDRGVKAPTAPRSASADIGSSDQDICELTTATHFQRSQLNPIVNDTIPVQVAGATKRREEQKIDESDPKSGQKAGSVGNRPSFFGMPWKKTKNYRSVTSVKENVIRIRPKTHDEKRSSNHTETDTIYVCSIKKRKNLDNDVQPCTTVKFEGKSCEDKWNDKSQKSCDDTSPDESRPNNASDTRSRRSSNTAVLGSSDDDVYKLANKSLTRSFEIQMIGDLLERMKDNPDHPSLSCNNKEVSNAGHSQLGGGFVSSEVKLSRSRSQIGRPSDESQILRLAQKPGMHPCTLMSLAKDYKYGVQPMDVNSSLNL